MIERLIKLQKEFSELYQDGVILGVDNERVHLGNEAFEQLAENAIWVNYNLDETYAYVSADVDGIKMVTLFKREQNA